MADAADRLPETFHHFRIVSDFIVGTFVHTLRLYTGLSKSTLCLQAETLENVPVEKTDCSRWPDADLDEICLQRSEM